MFRESAFLCVSTECFIPPFGKNRLSERDKNSKTMKNPNPIELAHDSRRTLLSTGAVLLVTSIHHIYGAIIYDTPWRYHIVFPSALAFLFTWGMLRLFNKRPGTGLSKAALLLASACVLIFPFAWIGLFEGGYNHLIKNALYLSGASALLMQQLFPPPTYEMPNDLFFEATGVLTFFIALPAGYYAYRLSQNARHISRA